MQITQERGCCLIRFADSSIWTWCRAISIMTSTRYVFSIRSFYFCRTPWITRNFFAILYINKVNATIITFTLEFEWKLTFSRFFSCFIFDSANCKRWKILKSVIGPSMKRSCFTRKINELVELVLKQCKNQNWIMW